MVDTKYIQGRLKDGDEDKVKAQAKKFSRSFVAEIGELVNDGLKFRKVKRK